jgi:hypothetical protein
MQPVQFIADENNTRIFAVVPIKLYEALVEGQEEPVEIHTKSRLLSADGRYVFFLNAEPNAKFDVLQLVDLLKRLGTKNIAIAQRAQTLDKFEHGQILNGLDPMLRTFFLPKDSPYRNTMQANNELVEALVETGIFQHTVAKFDAWYRPVKSLKINQRALEAFIEKHGPLPKHQQIDASEFM